MEEADNPDSPVPRSRVSSNLGDEDQVPVDQPSSAVDRRELTPLATGSLPARPFRPQPGTSPMSFVYLTQHTDFPAEIQTLLRSINASFDRGDYLYEVDTNAFWKLDAGLDNLMSWVASQTETDDRRMLRGLGSRMKELYFSLDDTTEGRAELIFAKREFIGWAMQRVGLATKAKEAAFEPLSKAAMQKLFHFYDPDFAPSSLELEKYGVPQLAGYFQRNMIDLGLDVFLVIEMPKKVYPFGSGKSTLMAQLLGACANAMDSPFDLRRDIMYQFDFPRLRRFFDDHTRDVCRGVDEGKRIWGRRGFSGGRQKEDMATLSMTRKDRQVWATCVSNVFRLDKDIWEEKATHVLRITDAGRTTIKRGWGQATLFEHGDADEDKDMWGNRIMPIKWVDLPPPPKRVIADCIDYTNRHGHLILDEDLSPLDELLKDKPEWDAEFIRDWPERDVLDWKPDGGPVRSRVDRPTSGNEDPGRVSEE